MKAKIIFIFLAAVLLSSSCSKNLLDVKNENTYTDVSYFKTQAQFNEAIIATLCGLQSPGDDVAGMVLYFRPAGK